MKMLSAKAPKMALKTLLTHVFGSGWWSSSEAELSFVSSWDGMMVSWPAIIMSIVRLSLMSLVVSVRYLGWEATAPGPRVRGFSLPAGVAARSVWSLHRREWEGRDGRSLPRRNANDLCKHLTTNLNYEMYKISKQAMHVYILFMHANLGKFCKSGKICNF